ncbi:hypothetical protein Sjap_024723 [Stephania japonica]|uniref:Uncharacterized protein n=1 Tax=Stephania japonica TaxID=461633 RepID=A0AAP0HP84_9MAGN
MIKEKHHTHNIKHLYIYPFMKSNWNALLITEEVAWINLALHLHQPIEITIEILYTPNLCFFVACTAINPVLSQIKISVIQICTSRLL